MKTHVSSNQQYQQLLDTVGSFGKYQIVLVLINMIAFFITGVYETALYLFFDLGNPQYNNLPKQEVMIQYCKHKDISYFPHGLPNTIPFKFKFQCKQSSLAIYKCLGDVTIVCGLLISGYLSSKYGYKRVLIGNSIILLVGSCILIIENQASLCISLILINLPQYSTCCLFLCLAIEVIKQKYVPVLIICMFTSKLLGNLAIDFISYGISSYRLIVFIIFIPLSSLFLLFHWFYHQSLRYLIDHDIILGLAVLNQIAVTNNTQHEQLHIGNEFIINKIRINRYKYNVIFKIDSVKLMSYGFTIVMFSLGILSQAPLFILNNESLHRNTLSILVSSASLLGTIPAYVYYNQAKRKKSIQLCCLFILVLLSIRSILVSVVSIPLEVNLSLILIVSCILTTLTCFIVITLVQSYPHTVRTLAYCLFVSFQFLGRFSCVIMNVIIKHTLTENILYIEAVIIIILYCLFFKQTKYKVLEYELKQLTEREILSQ